MYADAHCHLTHPDWGTALPEALKRARAAGITAWGLGGIEPSEWKRQAGLGSVWPAFGLHPWWIATVGPQERNGALAELDARLPEARALGELGLDRHRSPDGMEWQRELFKKQLDIARKHRKPLVLHVVKAHSEALEDLGSGPWRGIVHRFQGSARDAAEYAERGLSLSVGGPNIEKQARTASAVWRGIPVSRLVLETDAPWKNSGVPLEDQLVSLRRIAEVVGEAVGKKPEALLEISTGNVEAIFGKT